jgi:superoxide dismutase
MELHHSKHHNTYVTSYNTAIEKLQEAQHKGDIQAQIAQQPLINFHGGKFTRCKAKHQPAQPHSSTKYSTPLTPHPQVET